MKIGFIGAGRVGFTLGRFLKDNGRDVTGYWSRNRGHSAEAARFTDTLVFDSTVDLIKANDIIFLTVCDSAISPVYQQLLCDCGDLMRGKIIAHTSGACSSSVFTGSKALGLYGYSIHPIYAVSDKLRSYINFKNAYITVEGDEKYKDMFLAGFGEMGLRCSAIDKADKVKYHAAASIASNMVCGIYGMSIRLLTECGFTESEAQYAISGLFLDNAKAAAACGPVSALTGPIERGDIDTVKMHIETLGSDAGTYKVLAKEVLRLAKEKNAGDKVKEDAYEKLSSYL